jgi:hypothetical protein
MTLPQPATDTLNYLDLEQVRLRRSHEHVLLAPEKVRSGSVDSAGIERIAIAMRLSRGYLRRVVGSHHQPSGVISLPRLIGGASTKATKLSALSVSPVVCFGGCKRRNSMLCLLLSCMVVPTLW